MRSRNLAYGLFVSLFAFGPGSPLHAADAPKDNKGYTTSKTTVVDLGPEFPGMEGRQLNSACSQLSRAVTLDCIITRSDLPLYISCKEPTRSSRTTAPPRSSRLGT